MVATYGKQIKGMREGGKHKTRDSQRWKKVQVQDRRSYGEVEWPNSYLDKTNIRAGILEGEGWGHVARGHDII